MRLINPIIPGEYRYPTITPFTIPDGHTYLKTLEWLIQRMKRIIDEIDENNVELLDTVVATLNSKIDEINTAFAEFEGEVDDKLASVDTKITELETFVNTEISDLESTVNDAVQLLINNSIEVQDPVVAGLVEDKNSLTGSILNSNFETKLTVNVHDFGAVGDGETDDYEAIQNAIDSGASVVTFANKTYKISSTLKLVSNQTIIGYGAKIVKRVLGRPIIFAVLGGSGDIENVTIDGVTVLGDLGGGYGTQLIWAHRAKNLNVLNCVVLGGAVAGHSIDLQGCQHVRIINTKFYGSAVSTNVKNEVIQIDVSSRGGAPGDPVGVNEVYNGEVTRNVCVQHCVFDSLGAWKTSRPIGSHSNIVDNFYESIIFNDNYVGPLLGNVDESIIHFEAIRNSTFENNTFNFVGDSMPGRRRFFIHTGTTGVLKSEANDADITPKPWTIPMDAEAVSVCRNVFIDDDGRTVPYYGTESKLAAEHSDVDVSGINIVSANGHIDMYGEIIVLETDTVQENAVVIGKLPTSYRPVRTITHRFFDSRGRNILFDVTDTGYVRIRAYRRAETDDSVQPANFSFRVNLGWRKI